MHAPTRVDPVPEDELAALALAADPDAPIASEARSLWELTGDTAPDLLPDWYMPASPVGVRQARGWRRVVAYLIVAALVLIVSAGLCTTYGEVTRL